VSECALQVQKGSSYHRWSLLLITLLGVMLVSDRACAQDLPLLIRKHSVETRRAFREITAAIALNEKLSAPLADPYIARAEIWTIVGNYEGALEDYLTAVRLQSNGELNLAERAQALETLTAALERLAKQPVTQYPFEAEEAFWIGVKEFRGQRFQAAKPYFEESVRLNPQEASYRAFLALTLKRLGDEEPADRHALSARGLLRHPDTRPDEIRGFHRRLEGVNGVERQWLQRHIDSVVHTSSPSAAQ
jgi:tetratricopeptide (TPR) repeat protein